MPLSTLVSEPRVIGWASYTWRLVTKETGWWCHPDAAPNHGAHVKPRLWKFVVSDAATQTEESALRHQPQPPATPLPWHVCWVVSAKQGCPAENESVGAGVGAVVGGAVGAAVGAVVGAMVVPGSGPLPTEQLYPRAAVHAFPVLVSTHVLLSPVHQTHALGQVPCSV